MTEMTDISWINGMVQVTGMVGKFTGNHRKPLSFMGKSMENRVDVPNQSSEGSTYRKAKQNQGFLGFPWISQVRNMT